tara:strand:+ start:2556 stop:3173 length:618 start_codon:yes stop_codon:yes gene_type:complete
LKIRVSLFFIIIVIFYVCMNSKKIIIYQYDTLFNILNEIKDFFNFDIIKADKNNLEQLKSKLSDDYLIVSALKMNNLKNQLQIDKFPIKLNKLIELINLKFLKEKFNSQSEVFIKSYKLNLNSREMNKDDKIIDLTEREINLILFFKKVSKPVKINELQKEVWGYNSKLETHTVETHIYRLRKKIKEKFNDENFIISSKKGYLIN